MSRMFPDDPFLRGNYAPWPMEGEIHNLVVEGEIPRDLDGTLFRNGPNPQFAPFNSSACRFRYCYRGFWAYGRCKCPS